MEADPGFQRAAGESLRRSFSMVFVVGLLLTVLAYCALIRPAPDQAGTTTTRVAP